MSKKITIIIEDEEPYRDLQDTRTALPSYPVMNSACDGCSNNQKNGGSGVCWCTIPLMEQHRYTDSPYIGILHAIVEAF
jgi:hypothetical protein